MLCGLITVNPGNHSSSWSGGYSDDQVNVFGPHSSFDGCLACTEQPRTGLQSLELARRRPDAPRQRRRARRGLVAGRNAPGGGHQPRNLALRCPHRGGNLPDHRTFVQSQCGGVFARRSDAGKRQPGPYGAVVGRGHRTGEKHPHGTYQRRRGGGILAGWDDVGKRRKRLYGAGVGRGHRGGTTHAHGTCRKSWVGRVFT